MSKTTPTNRKPQAVKASKGLKPSKRTGNPLIDAWADRGWLLMSWLTLLSAVALLDIVANIVYFSPFGLIFGIVLTIPVIGLWRWRRWGFYGTIAVFIVVILLTGFSLLQTRRIPPLIPLIFAIFVIVGTVEIVMRRIERFK